MHSLRCSSLLNLISGIARLIPAKSDFPLLKVNTGTLKAPSPWVVSSILDA